MGGGVRILGLEEGMKTVWENVKNSVKVVSLRSMADEKEREFWNVVN